MKGGNHCCVYGKLSLSGVDPRLTLFPLFVVECLSDETMMVDPRNANVLIGAALDLESVSSVC